LSYRFTDFAFEDILSLGFSAGSSLVLSLNRHRSRTTQVGHKGLRATQAASVQLSVPILAALGGVVLLGEQLTLRLLIAAAAILGGIALVIFARQQSP